MSAAVARCSPDLRHLWVNRLYSEWVGQRKPEEMIGRPMFEVLGLDALEQIRPYIDQVLTGKRVEYERFARRPLLGRRRWIHVILEPTFEDAAAKKGAATGWVSIIPDIHDRKRSEDTLKAADRHKDDFLATLAHELRNPLAPIRNAVAILGRKGPLDAELAWSRDVIVRQVEQMSRLIEDLLDIERISRGKFLIRKERVALERAIDMALEMSRPYITSAGHHLSVLMPSEAVMIDADPVRLAQVFSNLLNNAAKFTERRGEISLDASVEADTVSVSVE